MAAQAKAFVSEIVYDANQSAVVANGFVWNFGAVTATFSLPVTTFSFHDAPTLKNDIATEVVAYSDTNSLGVDDVQWVYFVEFVPAFIANMSNAPADPISDVTADAPEDAPTDAPADAVTNYNVITTLLGTLTGALNASNAKQNEIAEKLNETAAKLNETAAKLNEVTASHNVLLAAQRLTGIVNI